MPELTRSDILIVDDNPDNLRFLKEILANHGYNVRPLLNGEMALNSINKAIPDIILMDIMMPGMSGYDACKKLKADERTRDIPVIFLSALNEVEDKVKAFSAGGIDYITKPFQEEEILARVHTHLKIRRLQVELQKRNVELQEKNSQLQDALDNVKTLRGLLPICSRCKKIRNDQGYWNYLEDYIQNHSEVIFSHGMCPECMDQFYGKEDWFIEWKRENERKISPSRKDECLRPKEKSDD